MKKVLVCPLDWGLGHATRCIAIIMELQRQGAEVIIGASGDSMELLRLEFPEVKFFELPAYNPMYSAGDGMVFTVGAQLPRFLSVIRQEHDMTEEIVKEQQVDVIISDNRYGCWSSKIHSVFLTHQVKIPMPVGYRWLSPAVNYFSRLAIGKFGDVWIPDQPGSGLTDSFLPKNNQFKYIGWISRFKRRRDVSRKYEIIGLVSGPEPQRSIFEKNLEEELKKSGCQALLVTGEPHRPHRDRIGNMEKINHLKKSELEEAILASDIVISRSGYSTIMDLIALGKKAIFVPTPGQGEQICLADNLAEQELVVAMSMDDFSLGRALEQSIRFRGLGALVPQSGLLSNAIESILI